MVIIGILASLAIIQFNRYKQNSYNTTAQTDLRQAITSEEAAFVDNGAYVSCTDSTDCEGTLPGFLASKDNTGMPVIDPFDFTEAGNSYTSQAKHQKGSIIYSYDSAQGFIAQN